MSEKRVTKKEYLGELRVVAEEAGRTDLVEFIDKEIEKLANRKAKVTKTQEANAGIKEVIAEVLGTFENPVTIADLVAADERLAGYTNQKISALLAQMRKVDKTVERVLDKKKAYFKLAN